MLSDDTADVLTLLYQFADFTSTQNWKLESQYSSKISPKNSKKLIGHNAQMTGNYYSSVVICSPDIHVQQPKKHLFEKEKTFSIKRKTIHCFFL